MSRARSAMQEKKNFRGRILTFLGTVKKGVSGAGGEATPLELLDGPLLVPVLTCRGGLPFTGPCSGTANTVEEEE